ncbi:hypothetical protein BV898_09770 [Hypsibius exemplaris]|uniref:Methyltransferase domain-containing protein n=1 Tax=Hypsibius exemplaris TaxID=2072580 RepID=A0A1W0WLR1_HYPEX|nr:hypothetical protein BV898_09770 [Hypsibius exemplaris]
MAENSIPANSDLPVKPLDGQNDIGWAYAGAETDDYITDFVKFAATTSGPVADLGCGPGHNVKLLLNAGTKSIIANDINEDHLKKFYKTLSEEETERAVALRGSALTLNKIIKTGTLGGILAANLVHFLHPSEVRNAFRLFYELLAPGGKLCVIAFSTRCGVAVGSQDLIRQRRKDGAEWPGLVTADFQEPTKRDEASSEMVYKVLLNPEELRREAEAAGFHVEKAGFVPRPDYPAWFSIGTQPGMSSGLTAVKP